ncbi:MAG: hypothetical protein FJX54_05520 [Alphaproteobacteria bacterium]|nr:hypothetical protein [Alphaproteobacteria bacterium]
MAKLKLLLGLGAACCAIPLAVPLLAAAGVGLAGAGAILSTWWIAIAGAAAATVGGFLLHRHRAARSS